MRRWRMRCRCRSLRSRSGMGRKFPVLHCSSRLAGAQILLLLRFERTPRVLLHRRLFLFERYFFLRRWILAYQRWPIWGRRSAVRRSFVPGRRR